MDSFRDGDAGQVSGGEFFLGKDGELVDSLGVGLGFVSIVSFNLLDVSFEDSSTIEFFSLGPVGTILGLPLIEGGSGVVLHGEVSSGQNGH